VVVDEVVDRVDGKRVYELTVYGSEYGGRIVTKRVVRFVVVDGVTILDSVYENRDKGIKVSEKSSSKSKTAKEIYDLVVTNNRMAKRGVIWEMSPMEFETDDLESIKALSLADRM
jgi:hypothetical protein